MIIKLVRHAESQSNVGEVDATRIGDPNVKLTQRGARQACLAGETLLGNDWRFFNGTLVYISPYCRTRETWENITRSVGSAKENVHVYEDPRLREIEWGYDKPDDYDLHVDKMREIHGKFYFRMDGGESPADGYDRISGFLETMMRQVKRKEVNNILIVTHGLTIRCFAMRFMHLKVEQFDDIQNPKHCDIVTITNEQNVIIPQFTTGSWQIRGLRLSGDPGLEPWPRRCPNCNQQEVWPNRPDRVASCERCSTRVEY